MLFGFLSLLMVVYLFRHYLFTLSILRVERKPKVDATPQSPALYEPMVSIIIPAYNEERVLGRLLQRTTELSYPKRKMQVIVVEDASTDRTKNIAEEFTARYPFIKVIHRSNSEGGKGKTSAMNAGFKIANGEITLCFDADYYPQTDIIEKLVRAFEDSEVGAVQGRVVVLNEPQSMVTRLVALERIGGYRVDQEARYRLSLITQFAGTVGGFRTSLLRKLGGWDESILAEDTDLTFRIYLAGYRIAYVQDAECYEEAVEDWRLYWRQRHRWAKGHMQCCFKHWWNLLRCPYINPLAKIDGLLLLNIYFMPLVVLASMLIGVPLIISKSNLVTALWFSVPVACYSFVGNFAPFFEVGIGAHLDGRKRMLWLIPLLALTFPYNIAICTKAFLDVLASAVTKKRAHEWVKTPHLGHGFIPNRSLEASS